MIGIVDYGVGNIQAFLNIYKALNLPAKRINKAEDFLTCSHIILPGVGAFDHAMLKLKASGLINELNNQVLQQNKPVLGICVGMQMLADSSEEGIEPGLGWISGKVKKLKLKNIELKTLLPHMGWNTISAIDSDIFKGFSKSPEFYFLHSYFFDNIDNTNTIADVDYGGHFTCAVNKNNIYGVQFHPEKSHSNGIKLLSNFFNIKQP